MPNILLIDDDERILRVIDRILSLEGYFVTTRTSFSSEIQSALGKYDLILLDVMMPEINGYDVIKIIRDETSVPIIFLTAKVQDADLVYGLGLGADDYIKKPFSPEELKARIQSQLRREQRKTKTFLKKEPFQFDLKAKKMYFQSKEIVLTKGEYSMCEYLARYSGQAFSKEQIFEAVFGYDKESNDNTITTHIKNIRAKLSQYKVEPIETVWGIGYRWKN